MIRYPSRPATMGVALTLTFVALAPGRAITPRPGGSLTIFVHETEEAGAVQAAIEVRLRATSLVHPDGARSVVKVTPIEPDRAGAATHWQMDLPWEMEERTGGICTSLRSAWPDLESCEAGHDPLRGPALALTFTTRVCNVATRLATWDIPDLRSGFRPHPERPGAHARRDDAEIWRPLLDEIVFVVTDTPPVPSRGEIVLRMPTVEAGPDAPGGRDPILGDSAVVFYRLHTEGDLPDLVNGALRELLARDAFEPLVPAHLRTTLPGYPSASAAAVTPPASLPYTFGITGSTGTRSDALRRRVAVLLERHGATISGGDASQAQVTLRLERSVLLGADAASERSLLHSMEGWDVLAVRVDVLYGSDVRGRLVAPDLLWRGVEPDVTDP